MSTFWHLFNLTFPLTLKHVMSFHHFHEFDIYWAIGVNDDREQWQWQPAENASDSGYSKTNIHQQLHTVVFCWRWIGYAYVPSAKWTYPVHNIIQVRNILSPFISIYFLILIPYIPLYVHKNCGAHLSMHRYNTAVNWHD